MIDFDFASLVFAAGLAAGVTLDLLLLRTLFAPPFRIWPTPEPGSWQSLTFWSLFRGGMVLTFAVALLDWNGAGLLNVSRFVLGLPLFLVGFGITVCGYFNLGLGNTYCGADGLVSHGLYRYSRNPQYASSIMGLVGLAICANSWLTVPLADERRLCADGAGRGGMARAALRCALSRLLRAHGALRRPA
jgi:protein-S-isoprenylcysteine O-methyltransferase Ste14